MIKLAGLVAAFLVAIGLAFYGGRTYQNNIDQPLFTAYNPPKTTGGLSGRQSSFFGGAAAGGSQVAAALAVATPPTSGGQLGGGGAAPAATPATGSGATKSAVTTNAAATDVAGTLQSIDGQSVTVKPAQGAARTVMLGAATTYYTASAATATALKAGDKVTLGLQPNASGSFGIGSVTIAPPGVLYGYVRSAAASAGAGGGGGQGSGGGGAAGGGRGFGLGLAATVTAVGNGSLSVQTATGRSFTLKLTSSTPVYQLASVAGSTLAPGAMVSVHVASARGKLVAQNVVASNLQGMVASLTTEQGRRRVGGTGGGGFGAGGGTKGG